MTTKLDQPTTIMAATITLLASIAEACPKPFTTPAELMQNTSWFLPLLDYPKPYHHPGMQQVCKNLSIWTSVVKHLVQNTPMAPAFDPETYTPLLLQDIQNLLGEDAPYTQEDYTSVLNVLLGKMILRCYSAYGALVIYRLGKVTGHHLIESMYRETIVAAKGVLVVATTAANMIEYLGTQTAQPYPVASHKLSVEEIEAQISHLSNLAYTQQSGWAPTQEVPYA